MSSVGETLRRARLAREITLEDAERVTRIHRKYLLALEQEDYGILPAPVYARGFLRSYASYLGLDPAELLPFFPVGEVDEPKLKPLPDVKQPRTWSLGGLVAVAVVGLLIGLVVLLYSVGREGGGSSILPQEGPAIGESTRELAIPPEGSAGGVEGPATVMPDLVGRSLEEAIAVVEEAGATYVIIGVRQGEVPSGQVVGQDPAPEELVQPGDLVTIVVSQ